MAGIPIGLQMYTLREQCAEDFPGTLKKVAEIGYNGVELAGSYGISASDLKSLLGDLGLEAVGTHTGIEALSEDMESVLEFWGTVGSKYLTFSSIAESYREDGDGWKNTGKILTECGNELLKHGFQLSYHNHSFEFEMFDGIAGFDLLYQNSDPKALHAQVDTYWVQHGNRDPVQVLKDLSGRISLVHIKDMLDDEAQSFAEIGEGILDWDGIFAACEAGGTKWYIVEQDSCKGDPIDSVALSHDNFRKMT